jgi:hypothetical protein
MIEAHTNGEHLDQRITTYTDLPSVQIQAKVDEANELLQVLETVEVQGPEQADQLGGLLKEVHREIKDLDTLRKEVGKPAREAQKDINDFFKPAIQAYTQAKDLVKEKLEAYARRVQEENQSALEQTAQGDTAALARIVPEAPAAGTSTRKELRIEVVNIDRIPREYLCVDYSALKILAKNGGEAPPGVEFRWIEKVVVGR